MEQGVLPLRGPYRAQTHGSSLERGRQRARVARQRLSLGQTLVSFERYRQILQPLRRRGAASLNWEEALQAAGKFQAYAEAALPEFTPEVRGIAKGSGIAFQEVWRVGIPRILYSRAVLGTQTVGQAVRACLPEQRAGGYNYLSARASGELCCVETSALAHSKLDGKERWVAHTNHYLAPGMQALEQVGRNRTALRGRLCLLCALGARRGKSPLR